MEQAAKSAIDFQYETAFVLSKVKQNLAPFMTVYPDDMTQANVYPIRRGYGGFANGANIGWTTGFWPGMIWLAYEFSGQPEYRQAGDFHVTSFLHRIETRQDVEIHDLGFMYSPSCVSSWKLTQNSSARRAALLAADHLMSRFWPAPGIFQAWGSLDDPGQRGRTIIDSLMNMPLLYWASLETGDPRYHQAALRHARRLCETIIRPDATTYHTYYYDTETGAALRGGTAQGAADDSCWARGQAWGIYGFALNYSYSRDSDLLDAACRLADYFLSKLPADRVPYWDLIFGNSHDLLQNAGTAEERDSSATAIAACGLLEIARSLPDEDPRKMRYTNEAGMITAALAEGYTSKTDFASNAILLHSVGSKPHGAGVNEASLWGDYFYMEALMRLSNPAWVLYW